MHNLDVPQFLSVLVIMLASAKLFGAAVQRIGQPAVLGELLAGVIVGSSVLGFVDPTNETLHLLAEVGVVILLFEIGLETDLRKLLQVGGASAVVALVGVVVPFALGYAVCWSFGMQGLVPIVAGASLTATSVGITSRVLSDLGRTQDAESRIVLGAAVIDDIIGLVILTVVSKLAQGQQVALLVIGQITGIAFGFLATTLLLGRWTVPWLFRQASRFVLPGTATMMAIMMAFGLAWLAAEAGSAVIIGAFAAGLLLSGTPETHGIERGVAQLGHFFVPLFFVSVGAAVDIRTFNPLDPANHQTLLIGSLLIAAAVAGKFLAGFAPFWFQGKKSVIGVGMIPRGEVGLIFAQLGLASGVFDKGLFSAVALMVMVTTFMAPPLLKQLVAPKAISGTAPPLEGIEDLVTEA
jgi:Kef-type K+ transport system membrane component KefB